ncbi:MAG: hypothetical protein EXQ59_01520 [Acidobacteria bacterium]|nr:hypothetical protein [Acidobacteriota bacterium]
MRVLFALVLGLGVLRASGSDATDEVEVIDRVLAVVAGSLITLSDVNAVKDLRLMIVEDGGDPVRQILPRLIDRALMLAEVERYAPPEPPAAVIDQQVGEVRARFPTDQAFSVALARVGFDERRLRGTIRQDLRILAYVDQRFSVRAPTEDDIGRYYLEHQQQFTEDGRLVPLALARPRVLEAATAERRQRLVDDWVAGLRRRSEIVDLSDVADR